MKLIKLVFTIIIFSSLSACNGPKSLTKKGNEFSSSGYHKDAVNYYIRALEKKETYIKAQIGLKSSAQAVFNEYTSTFFKAFNTGDNKTAVYTYIDMKGFVERVNKFGADLSIASNYKDDYEKAKSDYLEARFDQANELINQEDFNAAKNIFTEIENLDPDFEGRDFESLKEMAFLEPHYRKGNKYFNEGKFRLSYGEFQNVCATNPDYKNAKYKLQEALEKAQYSIGILRFENLTKDASSSAYISSEITNYILKSKNPFIKLIDRTNLDQVVNEQLLNMQGLTSSSLALQAGELIGAKALLKGSLIKLDKKEIRPRPTSQKAYKEVKTKKYDPVNKVNYYETSYEKVNYYEYSGLNEVTIAFRFQLISAETGQILLSEVIELTDNSAVEYATYDGNYNQLVPGNWSSISSASSDDKVITNSSAVRSLRSKFSASKELTPITTLQNDLEKEIAHRSAKKIIDFNPEEN